MTTRGMRRIIEATKQAEARRVKQTGVFPYWGFCCGGYGKARCSRWLTQFDCDRTCRYEAGIGAVPTQYAPKQKDDQADSETRTLNA